MKIHEQLYQVLKSEVPPPSSFAHKYIHVSNKPTTVNQSEVGDMSYPNLLMYYAEEIINSTSC